MFGSLEAVKGIFRHWPHISPSSHISGQFLANRLGKWSLLFLQPQSSLPHHGLMKKYVICVFASPSTVIMYGFWIANSRYPVSKTISRSSLCQSEMPSSTDGLLSGVLKRKLIFSHDKTKSETYFWRINYLIQSIIPSYPLKSNRIWSSMSDFSFHGSFRLSRTNDHGWSDNFS